MTSSADTERTDRSQEGTRLRGIWPIAISVTALVVSATSLFLTQLQPERIQVYPGEFAYMGTEQDKKLIFELYLTFTNTGARPGVAQKVALLLQPSGNSDGYILSALYFDRLDEKGNYAQESVVGPIPIDGHQTLSRQIRFVSAFDNPGDYLPLLRPSEYRATVLLWTSKDAHPRRATLFPFVLSDRNVQQFEEQRAGKLGTTVQIQNRQFQRRNARTISKKEMQEIIGNQ